MLELAIGVFLGLVLYAAFGAKAASAVQAGVPLLVRLVAALLRGAAVVFPATIVLIATVIAAETAGKKESPVLACVIGGAIGGALGHLAAEVLRGIAHKIVPPLNDSKPIGSKVGAALSVAALLAGLALTKQRWEDDRAYEVRKHAEEEAPARGQSTISAQSPPPPMTDVGRAITDVAGKMGWRIYTPDDSSFDVLLPGSAQLGRQTVNTPLGPVEQTTAQVKRPSGVLYGVQWGDYPVQRFANPGAALIDARNGALSNSGAKLVKDRALAVGTVPCREYSATLAQFALRARLCLQGVRLVQLTAVIPGGTNEDADVSSFLASFNPHDAAARPPGLYDLLLERPPAPANGAPAKPRGNSAPKGTSSQPGKSPPSAADLGVEL